MIDLHLHTTASDGLLSPSALVARARSAGLTIISVTDHDTVAGLAEAFGAADAAGIRIVPGIEVTAVDQDRDVHVLGYFIDAGSASLAEFLFDQRADRIRRVQAMGAKLVSLGHPVDVDGLIEKRRWENRSVGRPALADALVAAGRAASRDEAFERWLARGRPAYLPRIGPGAADVIRMIHATGGIASLAHPALLDDDGLIPALVEAGLDALEVWHTDHSPDQREHYSMLALQYGLARSGGSDFHGDGVHRGVVPGAALVPPDAFAELEARATAG